MDSDKRKPNENDIDLDSLLSYYSSEKKNIDSSKSVNSEAAPKTEPRSEKSQSDSSVSFGGTNTAQNQKKKFVIHIDEDDYNNSGLSDSQKPADSSSVYFSNYKGRNVRVVTPSGNETSAKSDKNKSENIKNVKKNIKSIGSRFAVILFACIILFTSLASYISITTINDILAITSSDDAVEVRIYKQTSSGEEKLDEELSCDEIIDILADNKLISQKGFCKFFAKFRHFDNENYKYKPGVYTLKKSMGVEGMLNKCLQQNRTTETVTVSFPEGWTITQMFEKLEKNKVCNAKALYSVLKSYMDMHSNDYAFLANVPQNEDRYQIFEGYLFPDTYDFYVESDPNFVIDKLFNSFNTHWTEEYQAQADKLGYSMDEIITIASIIQKEAANSSQMKNVSSVIHNRLKNSMNYPTLGCESTYDYISNSFDNKNFPMSQKTFYLNKYATDKNKGLPPGPISNPGVDAIEAALHPSDTNYYFFQHDKNGQIYLAETKNQFDYDYSVVQRVNNED